MFSTKPIVISIEGIISAGKTTFIESVLVPHFTRLGLKTMVIEEPVDEWKDILPIFYEDPARWATHFQGKAYFDRVKVSKDKWNKHKHHVDIFIMDRSIFSDPHFMKVNRDLGNVTEMEMRHYTEWWSMWREVMPFTPDLFVYLNASVEESINRIKKRNRNGESKVSVKYQTLLKNYHDETYSSGMTVGFGICVPVIVIDADIDYVNNEDNKAKVVDEFVDKVCGALNQTSSSVWMVDGALAFTVFILYIAILYVKYM